MDYELRVDGERCIASGICVNDLPEAFEFDDDDISVPIDGGRRASEAELRRIVGTCPSGAISVVDRLE